MIQIWTKSLSSFHGAEWCDWVFVMIPSRCRRTATHYDDRWDGVVSMRLRSVLVFVRGDSAVAVAALLNRHSISIAERTFLCFLSQDIALLFSCCDAAVSDRRALETVDQVFHLPISLVEV